MHTVVQTSTKHTPYKAIFGKMAGLPVDFNASSNYDVNAKLKDAETDDSLECAAKHQKKRSKQTLSKHKAHYDLRHGAAACFNVGSVVLRQDFTFKKYKGGKLDLPVAKAICDHCITWERPFQIERA